MCLRFLLLRVWFVLCVLCVYFVWLYFELVRQGTPTLLFCKGIHSYVGFPGGSDGKESACNARDLGSIPGLGRSPGEGKDHPVQYSGLEKAGSDRTEWKNPEAATIVSTQHTNRTGQAMPNR